jgi:osmotically-inducible protein OsmY
VLAVYDRPDADILAEVMSVLMGEFGLSAANFEATVSAGVVTLTGLVALEGTELEIAARIRHIEGVIAVRDRLLAGAPVD